MIIVITNYQKTSIRFKISYHYKVRDYNNTILTYFNYQ